MTMKVVHIRFVEKLYKNHNLHNRRHNYEIVMVKYTLKDTPYNNAIGKHLFMTHGDKDTTTG